VVAIPGPGRARTPTILAVDDDRALLRMIKTLLSKVGEVTTANDGQEALDLIKEGFIPDLIVTDLMMPRVDGMQLCEELKNLPRASNVPVIMLTAKGTPKDVVTGINVGARHYIVKPFKTNELLKKVAKVLGRTDLIFD
jgi:DNA-binding response OmpR family regulator